MHGLDPPPPLKNMRKAMDWSFIMLMCVPPFYWKIKQMLITLKKQKHVKTLVTFNAYNTWAGESNSIARWAGDSSWARGVTIQEMWFIALTLELCRPDWTLPFSIERPLEDWRRTTANLLTDHLCILLVKVIFTHWDPRPIRPHLQSARALRSIHKPHRLWKGQEQCVFAR